MKIRFMKNMFESVNCELELAEDALNLCLPGDKTEKIPYAKIQKFSVEGVSKSRKRFLIETKEKLYEGSFLQKGDAELLLRLLCQKCSCYVDIRLDAQTPVT